MGAMGVTCSRLSRGSNDASSEGIIVRRASRRGRNQDSVAAETFDKTVAYGDVQVYRTDISPLIRISFSPLYVIAFPSDGNFGLYRLQVLYLISALLVPKDELIKIIGMKLLKNPRWPVLMPNKRNIPKVCCLCSVSRKERLRRCRR